MSPQLRHLQQPCALIMAGGTGGHIFPGLALAQALRDAGWRVHWLGGAGDTMESRLVTPQGFALETIEFGGLRGKGLRTLFTLPLNLLRALAQSLTVLRRVQPDVVVGLGGYISFPAGLMAVLTRRPLILHEQNSVAGLANQVLARLAKRVYTAFPGVIAGAQFIGNPLREAFMHQLAPSLRFAGRSGPLQLLVVGGSLGAKALNDLLPQALALIPEAQRPRVLHQSGEKQIDALRANYAQAGVVAELTPFITDTASAFAQADLVIARAGASTVTELAAVGAAALFVPFPFAVDDHQTRNAEYLSRHAAAWVMQQCEINAAQLAAFLQQQTRVELMNKALAAQRLAKTDATALLLQACKDLATKAHPSKQKENLS
jgi:UDP-N-acetylglucosamine--N-acetylmuramyl-(pentapeptide) pyrophosphoryl-undecaprenol N-acetylglucosamine transferase